MTPQEQEALIQSEMESIRQEQLIQAEMAKMQEEESRSAEGGFSWDNVRNASAGDWGQALGAAGLKAANALTFGFGDEIGAGGNALIDALTSDVSISDAYTQRKAAANQALGMVDEAAPKSAMAIDLLGGALNPASRLIPGGSTVKSAVGKAALEGGLYGAGAGEGDIVERLSSAGPEALTGAGVAGGLRGAGKLAQAAAPKMERAGNWFKEWGLGVTATDRKMAGKAGKARQMFEATQQNPFDKALKTIEKYQIAGPTKSLDPETLFTKTQGAVDKINKKLGPMINAADGVKRKMEVKLIPKNTQDWLNGLVGPQRQAYETKLGKYLEDIADRSDGSFKSMLDAKQSLYKLAYSVRKEDATGLEAEFLRNLGLDAKEAIHRNMKKLADSGRLPKGMDKTYKRLGMDENDLKRFEEVFYSKAQAGKNYGGELVRRLSTTGGVTSPIYFFGPAGIPLSAAMYMGTEPRGRMIAGSLLQQGGRMAERGGNVPANAIARALASATAD